MYSKTLSISLWTKLAVTTLCIAVFYTLEKTTTIWVINAFQFDIECVGDFGLFYNCYWENQNFEKEIAFSLWFTGIALSFLILNFTFFQSKTTYLGVSFILYVVLFAGLIDLVFQKDVLQSPALTENLLISYSMIGAIALVTGFLLVDRSELQQIIKVALAYIYFVALKQVGFYILFSVWPIAYGGVKMAFVLLFSLTIMTVSYMLFLLPLSLDNSSRKMQSA